jgi:hypothetical protein
MKTEAAPLGPQNSWLPTAGNLKGILEIIAASVSVLAAAGYISLRAFLNFVGLTGVQELTVQQLLFECYAVCGAFVIIAVPVLCAGVGLCSISRLFAQLIKHRPLMRIHIGDYGSILLDVSFALFASLILVLTVGIYGSLTTEVLLEGVAQLRLFAPHPELFAGAVALTLLLICLALSSRVAATIERLQGIQAARNARLVASILAIFYIWISAITYNVHFRQLSFPIASIRPASSNGSVFCGLFLYATDQTRFVWHVVGDGQTARGVISAVPRQAHDQFDLLTSRSVVRVAQDVFMGRQGIPECSNFPTFPSASSSPSKISPAPPP